MMSLFRVGIFLFLSSFLHNSWASEAGERVALVIGNSSYSMGVLRNPVNDARAIAGKLESLGFKVLLRENLSREAMYRSIEEFGRQLKSNGVGLFFYAGHGMQIKGKNFLIPVDADIQHEDDIEFRGIDANQVLSRMDEAHTRINMVILDACRNNPFGRANRSGNYGLAQMEAPKGTLIAFSTAPGSLATDGSGSNSIYTRTLVAKLSIPEIPVEEVFKEVRIAVAKETHEKQIPWESTSLMGDFYFVPPTAAGKLVRPSEPAITAGAGTDTPLRSPSLTKEQSPAPVGKNEDGKVSSKRAKRDYDREADEIDVKAHTITAEQLPALIDKAEGGDVIAQTTLGWAYYLGRGQQDGRGIPRNNTNSYKWTLRAAQKGYPVAQGNLGAMYGDGVVVKRDLKMAQRYMRRAVDQGYAGPLENLLRVNALLGEGIDPELLEMIGQLASSAMKQPIQ